MILQAVGGGGHAVLPVTYSIPGFAPSAMATMGGAGAGAAVGVPVYSIPALGVSRGGAGAVELAQYSSSSAAKQQQERAAYAAVQTHSDDVKTLKM